MDTTIYHAGEILDQLMQLDISARGVIGPLYKAARSKEGRPLTVAAVDLLTQSIQPGDTVIIATGWVDQPLIAPDCGESDGPPGAVALARALRIGLKASPVILTDECLVAGIKQIARSAGFQCVPPDHLAHSIEQDKLLTMAVLPFPAGEEGSEAYAGAVLDRLQPAACIAIERGGMNDAGVIHNMQGLDTGSSQAKLDYVFRSARKRDIALLAIGDGGNEIGMANIASAVREHVPCGAVCNCPCGGGLTPATPVDVLLAATVSNWGAYAVAALLALVTGDIRVANDSGQEARTLAMAADAGFHDTISGSVVPGVDGCAAEIHVAIVRLMHEVVTKGLNAKPECRRKP